jgi:ribosomal protein L37AE/L43A
MRIQPVRLDETPGTETIRARSLPTCPICKDTVVAAEASALRQGEFIQHLWSCETCGYGFVTEGKAISCH